MFDPGVLGDVAERFGEVAGGGLVVAGGRRALGEGVSRALLAQARVITAAGWGLLLGPLVVAVSLFLAARGLLEAPLRRRVANRVPLVGPLWRWSALAEFCHLLALLLDCSIPLPEA